jgi:hypothetical protein
MKENFKKTENSEKPPKNREDSRSGKQISCYFSFSLLLKYLLLNRVLGALYVTLSNKYFSFAYISENENV